MKQFRDSSIDNLKGLLIILVVIGHLPVSFRSLIYDFHMPAFFLVTGLFLPKQEGFTIEKLFKKLKALFLPYLSFLLLVYILFPQENVTPLKLLVGGRALVNNFGPFWFITALGFGFALYYLILRLSNTLKYIALVLCYLISTFIFTLYHDIVYVPLNIDSSVIVVVFLFIGSRMHSLIFNRLKANKDKFLVLVLGLLFLTVFYYFELNDLFDYKIDIKYMVFTPLLLNLLVPLIFFVTLYSFIALLGKFTNILGYFGQSSLVIMYLHIPVYNLLKSYDYYVAMIAAIIIPAGIYFLLKKYAITSKIFLGK